jgi:hydrogenase maturation protease
VNAAGPAVLGIGNVLLGDDGAGPRVVDVLRELRSREARALPPATRLVDAGTLDLDALAAVDGAASLVLVDAVDLGLTPGTVCVLEGAELEAAACRPSADNGVAGLLALGRLAGWLPAQVTLVGVQAAQIMPVDGLSDPVAGAVDEAVDAVLGVLGESVGPSAGIRSRDTRARMAGGRTCA